MKLRLKQWHTCPRSCVAALSSRTNPTDLTPNHPPNSCLLICLVSLRTVKRRLCDRYFKGFTTTCKPLVWPKNRKARLQFTKTCKKTLVEMCNKILQTHETKIKLYQHDVNRNKHHRTILCYTVEWNSSRKRGQSNRSPFQGEEVESDLISIWLSCIPTEDQNKGRETSQQVRAWSEERH